MTYKQTSIGLFVITFIAILYLYYNSFAAPTIVYVDTNQLLENYEGMKEARQAYQEKANQWQANIDTLKAELDREVQQYQSSKKNMTRKEQDLNQKLIETKRKQFIDYQKGIQQKSQQEDYQMTEQVLTEVNTFIEAYGKQKGYTMILGANASGSIIYAKEPLDITEALQQALNDNYMGL